MKNTESVDKYELFRKNLIRVRGARGMSARELCEKAGARNGSRVESIESGRGRPSLEEVCAICKVLEVEIDKMMYMEATIEIEWWHQDKSPLTDQISEAIKNRARETASMIKPVPEISRFA